MMASKYFVIIVVLTLTVSYSIAASAETRLTGGENAKQGDYPFVVAFVRPNYTDCAGTILTKDWILTSGTCCFLVGRDFKPFVGSVNLKKGGKLLDIDHYVLHPEWEESDDAGLTHPNDICLVKLKKSLKFNKNIQQVTLAPADYPFEKPTETITLGWGARNDSYWATTQKLKIYKNLTAYPGNCPGTYGVVPFVGMICAQTEVGHSPCYRDEGGPLLYKNYMQIGHFSYYTGPYCSVSGSGVYVRTAHYVPWIQAVLGQVDAKELKIASYKEVPCRFTYCSPW